MPLTNAGAARVISGGHLKAVCTHLALFTSNPGAGGSMTSEPNGNGYGRQAITWSSSGDFDELNTNTLTFQSTGSWGTITHFGFVNSATRGGGQMFVFGQVISISGSPLVMLANWSLVFDPGELKLEALRS